MLDRLAARMADMAADNVLRRLFTGYYTQTPLSFLPLVQKMGLRTLAETLLRANSPRALERPLGSPVVLSRWEELMFNPVHLFRLPVPDQNTIDTRVTIGPQARKPLKLEIPVLVAGMSWGTALSLPMKVALAQAASAAGTATNTGEAPLLAEERKAARFLIGQYSRSGLMTDPSDLRRLDAIEIQLGQGAQATAPVQHPPDMPDEPLRRHFRLAPGQAPAVPTRMPGVDSVDAFVRLVRQLQEDYGVPVGLKLAASHHLEKELQIALDAGVDFVTVDGAEGGTHAGAPTLQDDVGLPTLPALVRTVDFLRQKGAKGRVSVLAAGGLFTPGQFLKALALGADAVYTGTAVVVAAMQKQLAKAAPLYSGMQLALYTGKFAEDLDAREAAESARNFLLSCVDEMRMVAYALGKTALSQLDRSDLCALSPEVARMAGVEWAYFPPEAQAVQVQPADKTNLDRLMREVERITVDSRNGAS